MVQSSVRAEHLRAMNMRLVLRHVLAGTEPPSRASIAASANLTRATASRLVDELVAGKIVEELPPAKATGPGRPAVGLVGARTTVGLGVDIGGNGIRVVATNLQGHAVASTVRLGDLVGAPPGEVISDAAAMVAEILGGTLAAYRLVDIVVAVHGLVDAAGGLALFAPNLGWTDVDVVGQFSATLRSVIEGPIPTVRIDNEANLAARTSAWQAPGRPAAEREFAYLSGGIGVGAAVVRAGEVVVGAHGWAGEIGHLTVDPNGPACRCGSTGCLERYVGREALATALGEAGGESAALEPNARALGIALAALVNLLDVPTVVVGGQLTELLARSRHTIESELAMRSMAARRIHLKVLTAPRGEDAAAIGASFAALEPLLTDPQAFVRQAAPSGARPPR